MLDKEAIRRDADLLVVADDLGVEVHRRGRKNLILCPCHNDRHIGSCFITETEFHCYSCHKRGDVFDFVQAVLNVGFTEAEKIVADINGGEEHYVLSDEEASRHEDAFRFIKQKDQALIGIHNQPIYVYMGTTCDFEEAKELRAEGYIVNDEYDSSGDFFCYSIQKRVESNPLYQLYKEAEELYHNLIDDFCIKKIEEYQFVLYLLRHPDDLPPYLSKCILEIRKNITENEIAYVFSDLIRTIQEISLTHGFGRALELKIDIAESSSIIPKPSNSDIITTVANSIWDNDKSPF